MNVYGIIPARLHSTRLPRKLLLAETGRPLIEYTWRAASLAKSLKQVIVAADSDEFARAVSEFGGRCELTGEHPSGTDRIAEVARRCCPDGDVFVNIQGDEPEIDPANIDAVVTALINWRFRVTVLGASASPAKHRQGTSFNRGARVLLIPPQIGTMAAKRREDFRHAHSRRACESNHS